MLTNQRPTPSTPTPDPFLSIIEHRAPSQRKADKTCTPSENWPRLRVGIRYLHFAVRLCVYESLIVRIYANFRAFEMIVFCTLQCSYMKWESAENGHVYSARLQNTIS